MPDLPPRLRDALVAAEFSYDRVTELLGEQGHLALGRNETTPAWRATTDGSPLATLTRLFLLQRTVAFPEVERALPGLVPSMQAAGFLTVAGNDVRAGLDIRPYGTEDVDWWVVSDLTPGMDGAPIQVGTEHVLGISPAATSLAQLTIRDRVGTAFDLGTGCGVQALHLAQHCDRVIATDVNERALEITRFNLALNGVDNVEVHGGSLFDPLLDSGVGSVDLIATNPPFVISPPTGDRLTYRDSGFPGDSVVERIIRAAPQHLNEGGWCQVLANWAITDIAWEERIGGWLDPSCDALIVQREVLDPAAYVELWLKDAGHHGGPGYLAKYDEWLGWLEAEGITGVGFGWLNLRRRPSGESGTATHSLLDWPYTVEQPIAPAIAEWGDAIGRPADDHSLLAARLVRRSDVIQETTGEPGAEDPEVIVLRQQRGFRRARTAGSMEAALVGACDGDLTIGQIADALAQLTEREPDELRAELLTNVRELVAEGFLGD
ncbi:MAG: methyltransferase [Nocardioides sp.]